MLINNIYTKLDYKNTIKELKKKNYTNIITWGLSDKTKAIINRKDFHIDYIVDNNQELQNTYYHNIPIVNFESINQNHNILLLWGNHCDTILSNIINTEINLEIILVLDETYNILSIDEDYFKTNHRLEEKKKLFKNMVKHIEIEPHSYCNRTCWFCPNSYIDRKQKTNYMNQNILKQLLIDLSSINYNKRIAFTRYSEPFGNNAFYDALVLTRNYLPNAILHANTNSDFLTNETLSKAYNSGLNSLLIQIYLNKDEDFNLENIELKANKIINKITDVKIELLTTRDDWVEYSCHYKDMNIRMYARDFTKNGTKRGDIEVLDKKYNRTSPCLSVFTDVYIDYNSTIVPCCNIRSDNKNQKHMNFGVLDENTNSIFNIYFSQKAIHWRNSLFDFNTIHKQPCNECSFGIVKKNSINVEYCKNIKNDLN